MKPTGFELYRYRLPFSEPPTLKGRTLRHREGLLLKLTGEGGVAGWGEASPLPGFSRETTDEAARDLRDLAACVTGREIADDLADPEGGFARELDELDPAPSARFGFELALCSLLATSRGVTLPRLLFSQPGATVPVNGLLSGAPERILEDVRRMRASGYRVVKLKVGGRSVEEDVRLVRALAQTLGDGVSIRLDANRAWSLEEAAGFARATAGLRFEYVEEPLSDPSLLPSFARDCGVPVALDETLVGMAPEALEDHRYARAVVLKPTLLGGISRTLRLASRARRLGVRPVISASYETGVGTLALVALAAGTGEAAGLDTYRRLKKDVLRPRLDLAAPRIDVRAVSDTRREVDLCRLSPVRTPSDNLTP